MAYSCKFYAILQKQKPQELYYVQQRNHFQIKGIATTKAPCEQSLLCNERTLDWDCEIQPP